MQQTDAFFTQTVVGAPFTALMGRRRVPGGSGAEGLGINLATGEPLLTRMWRDWFVLSHALDPVGMPRRRPGKLRLALERHALWLAVVGIATLVSGAAMLGFALWR